MIYLIDDTPVQMLEGYLKVTDYEDVLRRIDFLPEEDVASLAAASCVLMHSSYQDTIVKKRVLDVTDFGDVAPVVLFSDGDSQEARFNGDNYIISLKKSTLYSRLPKFLKDYRKTGRVNLKILAGEETKESFKSETISSGNVFGEFFSRVAIDLAPVVDESKPVGPVIYCVGRDGMNSMASKVGGKYVRLSAGTIKGENERDTDVRIHDFISESFHDEAKMFLLDTDADPELILLLSLHLRLTDTLPGKSKYAAIVYISDLHLDKLVMKGLGAQMFMTTGAYICNRADVESRMDSFTGLNEDTFRSDFLDRISIPAPKGSNHSLANQWGASRLYMIITGEGAKKDAFKDFQDIHKRLYFKYVSHKISSGYSPLAHGLEQYQVKGSAGKHILLIDDEADKGWAKTLSLVMPHARFDPKDDVIAESVLDFDELSDGAKEKIDFCKYDLILLDLRLGGIREDYVVNPEEMSGYKVLQHIKQQNRGTQVIMLTASNKAWNLKALMNGELGADGYFVKESPEYEFSDELSAANLRSLVMDMERCLGQVYLRDFWSFIGQFDKTEGGLSSEVHSQLGIAYEMTARARTENDFRYAFLALYQTLEVVTSNLTDWTINTDPHQQDTKLLLLPGRIPSKALVSPTGSGVLYGQKPMAFHTVQRNGVFPQKDKVAALYLQTWNRQDRGILFILEQLIAIRNSLIHPDNAKQFSGVSLMRERTFQNSPYFSDETLVFSSVDLKPLFREASSSGLLYSDADGRPVLHRDITGSSLGIRILLACLKEILPLIWS